MSVNPIQPNVVPVSFEAPKGGGGKALCSAVVPGLGQIVDGRNKAGAAFAGADVLLLGGLTATTFSIARAIEQDKSPKGRIIAAGVLGAAWLTNHVLSFIDAYKGGLTKK